MLQGLYSRGQACVRVSKPSVLLCVHQFSACVPIPSACCGVNQSRCRSLTCSPSVSCQSALAAAATEIITKLGRDVTLQRKDKMRERAADLLESAAFLLEVGDFVCLPVFVRSVGGSRPASLALRRAPHIARSFRIACFPARCLAQLARLILCAARHERAQHVGGGAGGARRRRKRSLVREIVAWSRLRAPVLSSLLLCRADALQLIANVDIRLRRYYHPDLAKQHLGLIRRAHRLNMERDRDNARVYGLASALAHTLNREECIDLLLVSDCLLLVNVGGMPLSCWLSTVGCSVAYAELRASLFGRQPTSF